MNEYSSKELHRDFYAIDFKNLLTKKKLLDIKYIKVKLNTKTSLKYDVSSTLYVNMMYLCQTTFNECTNIVKCNRIVFSCLEDRI